MLRNDEDFITLVFAIENDSAIIGKAAPFGAVELHESTGFEVFQQFMDAFYKELLHKKAQKVIWKHFPSVYDNDLCVMTTQALLNLGFILEGSAINFHIPAAADFEAGLAEDTLRRLRKAESEGLTVTVDEKFETADFFPQLEAWRAKRNIRLNVSRQMLEKQIESLQNAYTLFCIRRKNKLIAFSLGVKVSDKVLYKYLPAHDPEFDTYSPVILLTKCMHDYARKHDFKQLDLGIASEMRGEENYGLIRFKEKLGGLKTMKYTYLKELR